MSRTDSGLLVIDVQAKLMDKIPGGDAVISQISKLIQGAGLLNVPVYATEQYPKGLGPTVPELADLLPVKLEKVSFSCGVLPEVTGFFQSRNIQKILLAGVEAHVCVLQTALDLIAAGFQVYLAADAAGSRHAMDLELGLRRMEKSGVVLTTSEAALFEWTEKAGTPEFKQVSRLIVEGDSEKRIIGFEKDVSR
jgi:nicotinamidase-related amidase